MIKFFNTLSKRVEVFKPIDDVVKIYCCGVTVYDLCHLGHARSYIAWDVLRRFLIYSDYKVKYVQNFTESSIVFFTNFVVNSKESGSTSNNNSSCTCKSIFAGTFISMNFLFS